MRGQQGDAWDHAQQESEMYQPKHIRRWFDQINFEYTDEGDTLTGYYVAAWRYFRCSPVERSNFAYIREHLGDCGSVGDQVIFPAFTDAVMACRYYILVRSDFERGLRMADMFAERIARKGALDPDAEKRIDQEAVALTWRKSKLATRVALCQEAGVSVFAARREVLSSEPVMQLMSESA